MSTKQNNEEEVDLGSLFIIIGNGFKKLFNFIGGVFKGLFHFFILILLFIKENLIKFFIAAVIGAGIGGYKEYDKETSYGSDMLLQPNFKSTKQLYDNVNYYNDLVKQEQYQELSKVFELDTTEAKSIRGFEVTPIVSENDILENYDKLILSIDTLSAKSYSFLKFKKAFTEYDYKLHQVHVEATNNKVFSKLGDVIITSITDNEYFSRVKKITRESLYRTDSLLRQNLNQVDSLRQVYMRVMLEEAKKESPGTNIDFGGDEKISKELELFKTSREVNFDLRRVAEDISEKTEVINVISNFQAVGYVNKGLTNNSIFIFATLAVLLTAAIILLLKLNKFLESYKK